MFREFTGFASIVLLLSRAGSGNGDQSEAANEGDLIHLVAETLCRTWYSVQSGTMKIIPWQEVP